jgi:parallel beta-helix repeat protein
MKKITTTIALLLILCSLLVAFSEIGLVKALVINADGTVDQPDVVEQTGDVYILTGDILTLNVNRDNVTIDGDGHKILGSDVAVMLSDVNNVTLRNCIITGGGLQTGIFLLRSSNCVISNNLITKTKLINPKFYPAAGILVQGGGSHIISGNNLTDNAIGIFLFQTSDNIIVGNSIKDNSDGIIIAGSMNNNIYNNNFINNTKHVIDSGRVYTDVIYPSINTWDDGVTGNYWSNYTGQDTNGDNIGDTPHFIYENNQDNYPLMTPLDITVIPEFPSWAPLLVMLVAVLAVAVVYKRKIPRKLN